MGCRHTLCELLQFYSYSYIFVHSPYTLLDIIFVGLEVMKLSFNPARLLSNLVSSYLQ